MSTQPKTTGASSAPNASAARRTMAAPSQSSPVEDREAVLECLRYSPRLLANHFTVERVA